MDILLILLDLAWLIKDRSLVYVGSKGKNYHTNSQKIEVCAQLQKSVKTSFCRRLLDVS